MYYNIIGTFFTKEREALNEQERKRYSPQLIRGAGLTTITAHSACEGTPPNSHEHILAAIASGAEYIEVDVRFDGEQLYLSHDLPEDPAKCVKFDTLLQMIAPYPSLFVNCDVKTEGLLSLVAEAAKRYGVGHRVLFTGQCNRRGKEIAALGCDLWHSLWRSEDSDGDIRRAAAFCKESGCAFLNMDKRMVMAQNLDFLRSQGLNASVWTPDDEETLRFLLEKRVANITTRKPRLALALRDEIQGTPEENGLLPDGSMEKIIREASRIMLEADAHRLHITQKSGTANFVTEFDVRVQQFLESAFRKLFPDCEFLAEEEGEGDNPLGDGYTFVIDPIDGTTNFMLGRRTSAISVALLKEKKAVFGAVYDPYSNRYFSAMAGRGAFCNHRPICVSDREPAVGVASLGTAPYYREKMLDPVIGIARELLTRFGDIRRLGSAALEICAVACGEVDAYCEPILSPWDFAAAALILKEAGGVACDFNGNELYPGAPASVVAATPASREAVFAAVRGKFR